MRRCHHERAGTHAHPHPLDRRPSTPRWISTSKVPWVPWHPFHRRRCCRRCAAAGTRGHQSPKGDDRAPRARLDLAVRRDGRVHDAKTSMKLRFGLFALYSLTGCPSKESALRRAARPRQRQWIQGRSPTSSRSRARPSSGPRKTDARSRWSTLLGAERPRAGCKQPNRQLVCDAIRQLAERLIEVSGRSSPSLSAWARRPA